MATSSGGERFLVFICIESHMSNRDGLPVSSNERSPVSSGGAFPVGISTASRVSGSAHLFDGPFDYQVSGRVVHSCRTVPQ